MKGLILGKATWRQRQRTSLCRLVTFTSSAFSSTVKKSVAVTTPEALERVSNIMMGMFSKLHWFQISNVSPCARRGKQQHDYKIQTQRSLKEGAQRLTPSESCTTKNKVLCSVKMMLRVRMLKLAYCWGSGWLQNKNRQE